LPASFVHLGGVTRRASIGAGASVVRFTPPAIGKLQMSVAQGGDDASSGVWSCFAQQTRTPPRRAPTCPRSTANGE